MIENDCKDDTEDNWKRLLKGRGKCIFNYLKTQILFLESMWIDKMCSGTPIAELHKIKKSIDGAGRPRIGGVAFL